MNEAYIVSSARRPIGERGGWLKDCLPVDLDAHAMEAAFHRHAAERAGRHGRV